MWSILSLQKKPQPNRHLPVAVVRNRRCLNIIIVIHKYSNVKFHSESSLLFLLLPKITQETNDVKHFLPIQNLTLRINILKIRIARLFLLKFIVRYKYKSDITKSYSLLAEAIVRSPFPLLPYCTWLIQQIP